MPQDLLGQHAEFRRARQIGAVAGEIDAGQHDLGMAALDQRAHLFDHRAHRHRARIAAAVRNDAEGAAMIAAVLHLHEGARQAALETVDQMRRHLLHRHDVGDRDLVAARYRSRMSNAARASRQASPRILSSLPSTRSTSAMSANIVGLRLRRAAGDDDARVGALPLQPADRLPRLRHRLVGDGAAVDDDGIGKPGALRLAADHFGFEGIEAAAEGDDVDGHASRDPGEQRRIELAFKFERRRARSSAHGRRFRAIRW